MTEGIKQSRYVPAPVRERFGITAAIPPRVAWASAVCTLRFRAAGVECSVVRCDGPQPALYAEGAVRIGAEFGLDSRMGRIELGATSGGRLVIGDRVAIGSGSSLVASIGIEIGDDAMIGDQVGIFDNDFHPVDMSAPQRRLPVTLGSRSWVCRRSMIMPGVTVGEDSVVAAGAIVTRDVPPRTLVAGVPARTVRELDIEPGWRRSRMGKG